MLKHCQTLLFESTFSPIVALVYGNFHFSECLIKQVLIFHVSLMFVPLLWWDMEAICSVSYLIFQQQWAISLCFKTDSAGNPNHHSIITITFLLTWKVDEGWVGKRSTLQYKVDCLLRCRQRKFFLINREVDRVLG